MPIEESFLDLYRAEAGTQLAALATALASLAKDLANKKNLAAAAYAVGELKGAARLVGLDKAAALAQAMEAVLVSTQKNEAALNGAHLEALLAAVAWLTQYSQAPLAELATPPTEWMTAHANCLAKLSRPAQEKTRSVEGETPNLKSDSPKPSEASTANKLDPATESKTENRKSPTLAPPPPSSSKLDFSLLDLFRQEAETQVALFVQGLVDLEGEVANPKKIEPIMRAAHSLKGAARIIGLDLAVQITHKLEDALVAAQQGRLTLTPAGIDAFLRAADWLAQFSRLPQAALAAPPPEQLSAQAQCLADVQAVIEGRAPSEKIAPENTIGNLSDTTTPAGNTGGPAPANSVGKSEARHARPTIPEEAVIRVSAASLSRLMGLAAETLVEARRLQPFRDTLLKLKNNQLQFVSNLEAAASAQAENGRAPAQNLEQLRLSAQNTLESLRTQLENFDNTARRSTLLSGRLYQEVIASRLRPFADGVQAFPRLVRDVGRTLGKPVRLEIEGRQTPVDRDILEKLEAPLSHLLSNACDHGLESPAERVAAGKSETGVIRLEARHRAGLLVVQVSDDGRGVSLSKLRQKIVKQGHATAEMAANMGDEEILQFLFLPGFSTAEKITEISGRGVGLDVVQSLMQEVGGTVRIFTTEGRGTIFSLQLPVTRSVIRALLTEIDGETYAFPLTRLHRALRVPRTSIELIENRPHLAVDELEARLVSARVALGWPGQTEAFGAEISVIAVGDGRNLYGLEVDRILGETDLVVRPLDPRLGKVPGISAAALGEDGGPILIIDVDDLLTGVDKLHSGGPVLVERAHEQVARSRILVVDDSPTVRETERQILENAGYEVEMAVDGADGWNTVRLGRFDLVVSDVDMPRLNGFEFVQRIRADTRLQRLPVIIISYKDREEDRQRGEAAGADASLSKSSFQDDTFLRTVTKLLAQAQNNIV